MKFKEIMICIMYFYKWNINIFIDTIIFFSHIIPLRREKEVFRMEAIFPPPPLPLFYPPQLAPLLATTSSNCFLKNLSFCFKLIRFFRDRKSILLPLKRPTPHVRRGPNFGVLQMSHPTILDYKCSKCSTRPSIDAEMHDPLRQPQNNFQYAKLNPD